MSRQKGIPSRPFNYHIEPWSNWKQVSNLMVYCYLESVIDAVNNKRCTKRSTLKNNASSRLPQVAVPSYRSGVGLCLCRKLSVVSTATTAVGVSIPLSQFSSNGFHSEHYRTDRQPAKPDRVFSQTNSTTNVTALVADRSKVTAKASYLPNVTASFQKKNPIPTVTVEVLYRTNVTIQIAYSPKGTRQQTMRYLFFICPGAFWCFHMSLQLILTAAHTNQQHQPTTQPTTAQTLNIRSKVMSISSVFCHTGADTEAALVRTTFATTKRRQQPRLYLSTFRLGLMRSGQLTGNAFTSFPHYRTGRKSRVRSLPRRVENMCRAGISLRYECEEWNIGHSKLPHSKLPHQKAQAEVAKAAKSNGIRRKGRPLLYHKYLLY